MAFDFIQKKFEKYVRSTADQLFQTACTELMCQKLENPLVASVRMQVHNEKHVLDAIISSVKDMFSDAGMRAEIIALAHDLDSPVEFRFNVFDSREVLETIKLAHYYWSRQPGKFVNKLTGQSVSLSSSLSAGPAFTGTVREWYEILIETCIDASNQIEKKTLNGPAEIVRCGQDVATIFECSVLYRPILNIDGDSPYAGTICNRFKLLIDETMPRNMIELSRVRNGKKWISLVEVLDMNII